jgi:GNAT superfamily N-acetyltransferase
VLYSYKSSSSLEDGRGLTIRFKNPGDLKAWRRFVTMVPDDSGHAPDTELDVADLSTDYHKFDDPYLVAVVEGEIVGAVFVVPHDSTLGYHRKHAIEFHIDVLPGWRRLGVGSALVGTLMDWARARGDIHKLEAPVLGWNEAMMDMLTKMGFREEGRAKRAWMVKTTDGGIGYDYIVYMGIWVGPSD